MYDPSPVLRHPILIQMKQQSRKAPMTNRVVIQTKEIKEEVPKRKRVRNRRRNRNRNGGEGINNNNNDGGQVMLAAPVSYGSKGSFRSPYKNMAYTFSSSDLVASIEGSPSFAIEGDYSVNPGLTVPFSFLSRVAVNFQQYRFLRCRFRFEPACSTATSGTILISPDYNSKENPPTSLSTAMNNIGSLSTNSWRPLTVDLAPKAMFSLGKMKNIRNGAITGELNTYDAARVYVCVEGQSDTNSIGLLYIDYTVELSLPQVSLSSTISPTGTNWFTLPSAVSLTNGVAYPVAWTLANNPLRFEAATSSSWIPPRGSYMCQALVTVANGVSEFYTIEMYFRRDGTKLFPEAIDNTGREDAVVPTQYSQCGLNNVISFDGLQALSCVVLVTGTTGGLALPPDMCSLIVTVA